MPIRAKAGDVFAIPVKDDRSVIGVVASKWHSELLLFIFEVDNSDCIDPDSLASLEPVISSSSLDAKLWHGDWPIIGHTKADFSSMQPIYKIHTPDGWIAESFDRKRQSPINADTVMRLKFRKCLSPARLEQVVRAYFQNEGWEPGFDDVLYKNVGRL